MRKLQNWVKKKILKIYSQQVMVVKNSLFVLLMFIAFSTHAQQVPILSIADVSGKPFNTTAFVLETDKPIILAFWATWCGPCVNELSLINDKLSEWKQLSDFEFYAISVDDSRTTKKVLPFVNGKGWTFNVLIDKNQDLKRKLNIMNVPYTLVIKKGEIIYKHAGYVAGDEDALLNILMESKNK